MTAPLVTLSGIDGSGKSEWARRLGALCRESGTPLRQVALDDFRRPVTWTVPGRAEVDIYYDEYFDLAALDQMVARALAEPDASPIVVEGIMVLRVPSLAPAYAIYLETSRDEARHRIIERALRRGLSREEAVHRIDARYFPAQDRYQAAHDPAGTSDLLIDNENFAHPRIVRGDLAKAPAGLQLPLARLLGR